MKTVPQEVADAMRAFALRMPGAVEDHPWGERVAKVNKKIFVFLGHDSADDTFQFCVKLPTSATEALKLPGTEPAGYGMSNWATVMVSPARLLGWGMSPLNGLATRAFKRAPRE